MSEPGRTIKAIVFDTNVFGRAVEPNVDLIERWAEACERNDAELWIPEPVALELAERAVRASREHADAVRAHNVRRKKWGMRSLEVPAVVTADDVVENLVEHGAVIVEVSGDVARDALRDQILGEGPASTKAGVKTGASDSAWARAVIEHNGDDGHGLIIVTGDEGAASFLIDELGVLPESIVGSTGEIRDLLNEQSAATSEQVAQFLDALPDEPDDSQWLMAQTEIERQWHPFHFPSRGVLDEPRFELQDRAFTLTEGPKLRSAVEYDAWSQSLTARVQWVVTVDTQYADLDSDEVVIFDDEFPLWIEGDVAVMYDEELNAWAWAEFEDGQVTSEEDG